ncbi:MAG: DUF2905 domain-containing protein [Nitrospiraceae bacterium]|jgi:hypothetical protein|nr:MAG: DUF2905 domain-containing protein [Nitrospiraceae bacterium]
MVENFHSIGKILIVFGIIVVAVGILLTFIPKIPWLGKLPGDILIQKRNITFYFPLVTCIIISIVLTILFSLIGRR